MSLVLAFGLSPLGQVKAYAETSGKTVASQSVFTAQAVNANLSIVLNEENLSFTGKALTPTFTVKTKDTSVYKTGIVSAEDYDLTVKDAAGNVLVITSEAIENLDKEGQVNPAKVLLNAGTYTAEIKGKPDTSIVNDTQTLTFKVAPYDITNATNASVKGITLKDIDSQEVAEKQTPTVNGAMAYTGEVIPLSVKAGTLKFAGAGTPEFDLAERGDDFELSRPSVGGPDTYEFTLNGVNNLTGKVKLIVRIDPRCVQRASARQGRSH